MMQSFRWLAAGAFALALGGCSVGLIQGGEPDDLYDLTPAHPDIARAAPVSWQLVIEEPSSPNSIDTDRIAIRPAPREVKYVAGAKWADRAPALIQTLLVETFENSGGIIAVGRRVIGLSGDYILKSDLRAFEAERTAEGKTAIHFRLHAKLLRVLSGTIIASRSFDGVATAASDQPRDIVAAFDQAVGPRLAELVTWTLREGEAFETRRLARP
ncbi:MAG: hypothetical protein GC199_10675 [Alphaproteobacteria bacterium]|nr:hypothetical protein [Alphaproteobacteria bacterium]